MSEAFDIGKKIVDSGIKKADFLAKFAEDFQDEAGGIFDKFNTNTAGDSKDILDVKEQVSLLAYFNSIDTSGDGKISDDELNGSIFSDFNTAKTLMDNYNELSKTGTDVIKDSNGYKVDNHTYNYTYSNGEVATVKTTQNNKTYTQTTKPANVLATLSEDWDNHRTIGNSIKDGTATDENIKKISSSLTAKEVLDNILLSSDFKNLTLTDEEKNNLLILMIKANPSIFNPNKGTVYLGADWGKFDFPDKSYVEAKEFNTSDVTNTGAATIASSTSGENIESYNNQSITISSDYVAPTSTENAGDSNEEDIVLDFDGAAKEKGYKKTDTKNIYYSEQDKKYYEASRSGDHVEFREYIWHTPDVLPTVVETEASFQRPQYNGPMYTSW